MEGEPRRARPRTPFTKRVMEDTGIRAYKKLKEPQATGKNGRAINHHQDSKQKKKKLSSKSTWSNGRGKRLVFVELAGQIDLTVSVRKKKKVLISLSIIVYYAFLYFFMVRRHVCIKIQPYDIFEKQTISKFQLTNRVQ